MAVQPEEQKRFQILSLDGGGMKGAFPAAFLAALEQDLATTITDHFDLIAGTSTGGIIALGLGLGLRPREIVQFYHTWGRKIFPKRLGFNALRHWVWRKYSRAPLERALRESFGEKKFGESTKRLVIPSYNLGENDVYIFRTPHHMRLKRDYLVPAWKVGLATAAAPTFFACFRGVDAVRLIDGGVWANNPTMVAVVEAYETLGVPLSAMRILSIGTTDAITRRRSRLNLGGILPWAMGNAAIDTVMRGQSIAAKNQATFLVGAEHIERIDPTVAEDDFNLDGVRSVDDLVGKAAHYSRKFAPAFSKTFGDHLAAPFVPLFKEEKNNAA